MKPLDNCTLRTAGLASINSAKFGMVRKNADDSPRAHQGIDLQAANGMQVFAVDDGIITGVNLATSGYGYTITLKLNNFPLFAFYAHLSEIAVKAGDKVNKGQWIAKTGHTGNAEGMDTVAKGGHLHFELRTQQNVTLGLAGRVDPLRFVELDT